MQNRNAYNRYTNILSDEVNTAVKNRICNPIYKNYSPQNVVKTLEEQLVALIMPNLVYNIIYLNKFIFNNKVL